jgi:hypothetical protein
MATAPFTKVIPELNYAWTTRDLQNDPSIRKRNDRDGGRSIDVVFSRQLICLDDVVAAALHPDHATLH